MKYLLIILLFASCATQKPKDLFCHFKFPGDDMDSVKIMLHSTDICVPIDSIRRLPYLSAMPCYPYIRTLEMHQLDTHKFVDNLK